MLRLSSGRQKRRKRVPMSDSNDNEVYLSAAQIREWKNEYETLITERNKLAQEIGEMQQRQNKVIAGIGLLNHKLKLAVPFAPGLADWIEEQNFIGSSEEVALPDAILKVMARVFPNNPHVMMAMIHQHLPNVGYQLQKLQQTPNYFGIALKRLVARGLIAEHQKGQYGLTQQGRMHAQQIR
jgi:hypothetical protein